jgi:hypothetical protein
MKRWWTLTLVAALAMSLAAPASAITRGGVPDGDDHPYVGLMVAEVEIDEGVFVPAWRCSGALISPTVYVTAGHCTFGAGRAQLWFDTSLEPDPDAFGYPFTGDASGTPHTLDGYEDDRFYLADLGVVVLDEPVELDRYASLAELGAVDRLGKGRQRAQVTAVGYGLQQVVPTIQDELTRYRADAMVVDTTGVLGLRREFGTSGLGSFSISGDARGGGTCFGDSGGPVLQGDTILGVVSFGMNGVCGGIGGIYRVDRAAERAFIGQFQGE